MGSKSSKYLEKKIKSDSDKLGGMSKDELTAYLASVSHMAHTGDEAGLPEIRINDELPEAALGPEQLGSVKRKMRARLRRQMSLNHDQAKDEHVTKQLELLDGLESQDDTSDWAEMRSWLVWCLHNNLDDVMSKPKERPSPSSSRSSPNRPSHLNRQISLDKGNLRLVHQGSASFDSTRSGKISGQSSFDSCGINGET